MCLRKILFPSLICLIILSKFAFSENWKREDNIECSIKTNHPELLETIPRCTSWTTNFQYQQTLYQKTDDLLFYGKLQLAQPGYYWYSSGKIQKKLNQFNFVKKNIKFKKSNSHPVLSSNYWSRKPDNFDVEIKDSKYNHLKCFGFWDGSGESSNIGRRHNIYGMICNTKGKIIEISKRKEYLDHIFINHKYVNVNPKTWTKITATSIENKNGTNRREIPSNVLKAQKECKDIGFTEDTKKFDNCVEMIK